MLARARAAFGSPVSSVSANDIRADLADLGADAEPVPAWSDGVLEAVTPSGDRLGVRVIGRDDWDNEIAVLLWRFLWYRHSGTRLVLNPRQRVEHHGHEGRHRGGGEDGDAPALPALQPLGAEVHLLLQPTHRSHTVLHLIE